LPESDHGSLKSCRIADGVQEIDPVTSFDFNDIEFIHRDDAVVLFRE
jgi:hypothetical protein